MAAAARTARCLPALAAVLTAVAAHAAIDPQHPALAGVNPDMLSGGLYAALHEAHSGAQPVERAVELPGATASPLILDARIGANVAVGDDPVELPSFGRNQAEPHIWRSASDPDFLVSTFQEGRFSANGGAYGVGYGVTRDGGLTWTRALIPGLTTVSGGTYFRATDPVAGIDRSGNIYLNTLVSLDDSFGLAAVVLSKSTDGGATFAPRTVIFQPSNTQTFPDKNWMVVNDYPGTFSTGRVLVTWTNFTRNAQGQSTGNNIVSSASDNGGASFGGMVNITAFGTSKQGTQPMFFNDGTAGVAYITFLDPNNVLSFRIQYQHSNDGGLTWPGPERSVATVTGWDDPVLRDGAFLISAANARTTGRIVIAATIMVSGTPRIVCYSSTDRGVTWSGAAVASDNPLGRSVVNPAIAISDDGQQVSIIYYEKAATPDTENYVNIKAVHSFDGGATWGSSVLVSDVATDVRFGQFTDRGYMLGDYQGLARPAGPDAPPVALWIDTRRGGADPYSARVVPASSPDYATWRRARMPTAVNLNASTSAITADPDNDGLPNGLEYPLVTDPLTADFATPFGYTRATGPIGPELVLSHPRRSAAPDALLEWDRSLDGVSWSPVSPRTESSENIRQATAAIVTSTHPLSGESSARFRLRAIVGGTPAPSARWFAQSSAAQLVNVSTRGRAGTGENVLIGGFVHVGSPQKQMLVRAVGPNLAKQGITDPLADPRVQIIPVGQDTPVAENDDWEIPNGAAIAAAAAKTGAAAFDPGSKDAAVLLDSGPGGHTAILRGANGTTGVALIEVFDSSQEVTPGRLVNISTRGRVGAGEDILIAGFFITGTEPKLVLVRGIGPQLGVIEPSIQFPLLDPQLRIFRAGENTPIATIDDWGHALNPRIAIDASLLSGAFPLPDGSADASFLLHLPPGGYTAQLSGVGGTTGVALVEVYEVN